MPEHDCSDLGFATRSIHVGYDSSQFKGALNVPVFRSSTYEFDETQQGSDAFMGKNDHPIYVRLGCPTSDVLEKRIASLEGTEAAVCFASGMGAISGTCWTLLEAGVHVLISDTLYGCTWAMFDHMRHFGVDIEAISFSDPAVVIDHVRPNTRMVYFETPANPVNLVIPIREIAEGAHAKAPGCYVVVDNTFSTPVITRPHELGADVVVHSATKYLSGHGDLIAGLACSSKEICARIRSVGLKDMTGAVLSPDCAHLLMRGIKTLELRMQRHSSNALAIAEFMKASPHVARVMFPGLKSDPQHELATKQMSMPHGIVCVDMAGTIENVKAMMDALKLCKRAVSLGDCETLVEHPATMTHATYSPEDLEQAGILPTSVRISAGLENIEDILADLGQAIDAAYQAEK